MHPSPQPPGILDWAFLAVIWSALSFYLLFQIRYYWTARHTHNENPKP
jgi:hypothetical protein